MSVFAAVVKYNNSKHCFASLSSSVISKMRDQLKKEQKEVIVISVEYGRSQCVFLSCPVEISPHTNNNNVDVLELNGIFATKIGLKEDEEVVVRIENSITRSKKVYVEPHSTDDWEILEENASFIESNLLDQVRVVWPGEILPVWINKSICTFIRIDKTEPWANFILLDNDTEVYVSPKIQHSVFGGIQEPLITPNLSIPSQTGKISHKAESPKRPTSLLGDNQIEGELDKSLKRRFSTGHVAKGKGNSTLMDKRSNSTQENRPKATGILGYISSFFAESSEAETDDGGSSGDRKSSLAQITEEKRSPYLERLSLLFNSSNFVFRIQPMSLNVGLSRDRRKDEIDVMFGGTKFFANHSSFQGEFSLLQPSSVFISKNDLCEQFCLQIANFHFPKIFIAKLKKILSPKENEDEKKWLSSKKKDEKSRSKLKSELDSIKDFRKGGPSRSSSGQQSMLKTSQAAEEAVSSKSKELSCLVKVVIVDTNGDLTGCSQLDTVVRLLQEQSILKNHVVVPDLLRRQLRLDKTGKISLQPVTSEHEKSLCKIILLIVGSMSQKITFEMVKKAFREWIKQIAPIQYPLVTTSGLFVRFPVFQESWIEALISTSKTMQDNEINYHFVHRHNIEKIDISVVDRMGAARLGMVVQHPAFSVADFDPPVPSVSSKFLGGIHRVMLTALRHIEICLGTQPLIDRLFSEAVGLQNGMLLITGSKGAGKTSVVRALCKQVAEYPNLAHITSLSCKPLRGKKVESIQKILEFAFDEASWRQPSVIVLDDLDHIAGSVSNPDAPIPGEEHYKGRIAEVLKILIMLGIQSNNKICIIATAQTSSSLFSSLLMSRGTHFIQETIHIDMPNKAERKEILKAIIDNKVTLSRASMDDVVLDGVIQRTEGFVARDLENLVNRAIHAYMLLHERAPDKEEEIELSEYEFDAGLKGFTPVSLRNVPLHTAGDLGWSDVGGLTEVKKTLQETLLWPTKYPTLLSNCPLRLRSGLLLFGAPGTGKTLLAGVVAKECGLNFISIKGPELLSKYIGASEQAVRDMFYRAQSAKPCILFFDEFDSIAPRRGHDSTGVTDRVVNQLLTQLDGVEALEGVYVLGATSRPDLIDPALLRPGRLDKCLHCGLPNEEERIEILGALAKAIPLSSDVNLNLIASQCEHFTGADFKALLYNAQLEAIHEFTKTISNEGTSELPRRMSRELWGGSPPKAKTRVSPASDPKCPISVVVTEDNEKTSNIAYIPKLEDGIVGISKDMAEKVSLQLENLEQRHTENLIVDWNSARQRRSSIIGTKSPVLQINQSHFKKAMGGMRLSVSAGERLKYQTIYDRFVQARGAHFGSHGQDISGQKATLA